jgi:hypothetical protein
VTVSDGDTDREVNTPLERDFSCIENVADPTADGDTAELAPPPDP